SHSAGPAQEFSHPDYDGRIGLIMPYSQDFCDSCNRLRISSKGKLHLCLFGEQGLPLRELMQSTDSEELQEQITEYLKLKKVSHFLQDGNTGGTKHLAMIGG
ncbi:MAG: GTP 3',8-cyclase MoaA, partial [Kangiellaceae bacterium]|nr:GTP 3',8-cyclase MoaA [Kangiellaceae bacterium]